MFNPKRNKRGIELEFGTLILIALLVISAIVIIPIIKYYSSKTDEKLQVDLCRVSNEINYQYVEEKTKGFVSSPQICNTIDKTKPKLQVPTRDYPKTKEGAELEIREMIKNCWYMWLEGSYENMFDKMPFGNGCFTCYTFKVEDKIKGVTLESMEISMNEPFFVADKSDDCSGDGGFWRTKCQNGESEVEPKNPPKEQNLKCCVNFKNKCENKGGKCSSEGAPKDFPNIYNEWQCPKNDQSCYVAEDSEYSYLRYIREYEARGGNLYFSPDEDENPDVKFDSSNLYAISFVSPNGKFCLEDEQGNIDVTAGDAACYATFAVGSGALGGTVAAVWIHQSNKAAAAKLAAEIDALTRVLEVAQPGTDEAIEAGKRLAELEAKKSVLIAERKIIPRVVTKSISKISQIGTKSLKVGLKTAVKKAPGKIILISIFVGTLEQVGILNLEEVVEQGLTALSSPITDEDPNFMMVTTQDFAQKLGCTIEYGK